MTSTTRSLSPVLLLLGLATLFPNSASAGGYDTPILYSARHMGMGGTAVASVSDASALFHNPAGLGRTERLSVMGDFSLLLGSVTGVPDGDSIDTETTAAPFFLVGVSGRISEALAVGLAVYPSASAGGTYRYGTTADGAVGSDSTQLFFLEISPGFAVTIPDTGITFGAGYRITYVSLSRSRDIGTTVDLNLSGVSFAGFRFGMQYQISPYLSLGLQYRHETTTDVEGSGALLTPDTSDGWKGSFTLPSRFSFGARGDFMSFGVAVDVEYALQSDVGRGEITGGIIPIPSISDWSNAWTVRAGAEYRLLNGKLPIRLGYVWDGPVVNRTYPTAFGTPSTPTHSFTAGIGYNPGPWQVNLAYAYRTGSTTITDADVDGADNCLSCGGTGDYAIGLHGIYVDFSFHFGRGETHESIQRNGVVYHDEMALDAEESRPELSWVPEETAPEPAAEPTAAEPAAEPTAAEPAPEPAATEPAPEPASPATDADDDSAPTAAPNPYG